MKKRRQFFKTALGASVASLLPSTIFATSTPENRPDTAPVRAKALKKGDTIGLVAPGYSVKPEILEEAKATLIGMGFIPYHTDRIIGNHGYFSNTDEERIKDLNEMFSNPNIDGILCARGGYGCTRIMNLIDYENIRQNPKAFIGFSDITVLLNAINQKTGLITFHGPVGSTLNHEYSIAQLQKAIMAPLEFQALENKDLSGEKKYRHPQYDRYTITPGIASGKLVGGSLTLVTSLMGTPHEIDFTNTIICLEEIEEAPYRIDRMLTQLMQSKTFYKASGIVMGVFAGCDTPPNRHKFTLKEVILDRIKPLGIPAVYGMTFGHIDNNFTFPIGATARLDSEKIHLEILEKPVLP
ncbi:LD-carboxypeptidase [Arenibacter sp. 6A1]|uniref:S66 peptidase family protein n=1 Tax=Arenibacter sp. 6A1 TaxID=2720391 RepID=UPI0014472277|nr:LD-carboxypeptidase [Arenibacter sp. 6A1]NKI26321.1 LD-carboxypeptidase [Arenibacter sp. 6A1]